MLLLMLRTDAQLLYERLAGKPDEAEASPLSALSAARSLGSVLDDVLVSLVRQARAEGSSWAAIGYALGVSRQAAFQRFGHRSGDPPATAGGALADARP